MAGVVMRGFLPKQIREAIGHALGGGFALHLHTLGVGAAAPAVFRRAVARGEWIAHLFGQDADGLQAFALELGVGRVVIDRRGEAAQHVDLCGAPLARALSLCDNAADLPARPLVGVQPAGVPARRHEADRPAKPPEEPRFGNLPPLRHSGGLFGGTREE